jgi:hypothetical protein
MVVSLDFIRICFIYRMQLGRIFLSLPHPSNIMHVHKRHHKLIVIPNSTPIEVWFVKRVWRMRMKFGNRWAKYKDLIDLMGFPSNMEIGLYWYHQVTTNMWTYILDDNLIVYLETIIALASITIFLNLRLSLVSN